MVREDVMKQRIFSALLACLVCTGLFFGTAGSAANTPDALADVIPGIYMLGSALDSDFVLDVKTCTAKDAPETTSDLQMYSPLAVNQQNYYLERLGDVYRLTSLASGFVLASDGTFSEPKTGEPTDLDSATGSDGTLMLAELPEQADSAVLASQTWKLYRASSGRFYLEACSGGFLTAADPYLYNGALLTLSAFTGEKNQQWVLRKSRIFTQDYADTDVVNPYAPGGKYHNLRLSMWFGTRKETLTSDMVAGWFSENEAHELCLDSDAVQNYTAALAQKYDTQGKPRTFTTTGGSTITLYKGNFGWKLDEEQTAERLLSSIESNTPHFMQPVWSHTGRTASGDNDIGDSYVEVDLTGQKVWLYQDGVQVLETDCVTGTYGTDRQTPGGVYSIYYMQSPAVLRGADYTSPVDYWMAFNGGIGLHDANWRSEFGGDIFRTNGSHGCVNLPTDAAKKIYETVSKGYPVVCYN